MRLINSDQIYFDIIFYSAKKRSTARENQDANEITHYWDSLFTRVLQLIVFYLLVSVKIIPANLNLAMCEVSTTFANVATKTERRKKSGSVERETQCTAFREGD